MFKIETTVACADDARLAAELFRYLAERYGATDQPGAEQPTPAAEVRRPGRPRKGTQADPVDQYNALAGVAGSATVPASDPVAKLESDTAALVAGADAEEPADASDDARGTGELADVADTRTRDELLADVRALAQAKGALWLRPILTDNKVGKLSDLADDILRALLANG